MISGGIQGFWLQPKGSFVNFTYGFLTISGGNRSQLIRSNSSNIRSEIWRRQLAISKQDK